MRDTTGSLFRASRSGEGRVSPLWRGTVNEVYADGTALVTVPRLAGPEPIGRLTSIVRGLAPGNRVLVAAIEGRADDLVIIGAFD